jgi:hypothetical protein
VAAVSSRPKPVVNVDGAVEQPDIRVGDSWKYQVTDGYTNLKSTVVMEVASVTDAQILTRSAHSSSEASLVSPAGGVEEEWDRNWNLRRAGDNAYKPSYPSLRFPLEAGKRWTGRISFRTGSIDVVHDITAQVVGWERITVPAGSFDSVKITLRGRLSASGGGFLPDTGDISETLWYSPLIRQLVRRDIRHTGYGGNAGSSTSASVVVQRSERWELLEHKAN